MPACHAWLLPPLSSLTCALPCHSEEDAKGMARLFAEVGEAYTALIVEGGPQVRRDSGVGWGLWEAAGLVFASC